MSCEVEAGLGWLGSGRWTGQGEGETGYAEVDEVESQATCQVGVLLCNYPTADLVKPGKKGKRGNSGGCVTQH